MPIGKITVPKWQCDFDCKICANVDTDKDGQERCQIMAAGKKCIHADNDRHVRADYFIPLKKPTAATVSGKHGAY